jgi:hypothetical protein
MLDYLARRMEFKRDRLDVRIVLAVTEKCNIHVSVGQAAFDFEVMVHSACIGMNCGTLRLLNSKPTVSDKQKKTRRSCHLSQQGS